MNRRFLRFAALVCALCVLLALPASAAEAPSFSDVSEDDWFYAYVSRLAERGILNGFEDGTFRPADTLTNAQLVKLLLVPSMTEEERRWSEGEWWQPYADFGLGLGFLTGEDIPRMEEPVDRYRAAQLLARLDLLPKLEGFLAVPDRERVKAEIADLGDIPADALEAVIMVWGTGIIRGYDDGCFHGERILTRAECAAVIWRWLMPEVRSPLLRYIPEDDWLTGTLLLGNSHCGGLSMYGELTQPDYCFAYGGSIFSGLRARCRDRNERSVTPEDCLRSKPYDNVVLIFGTNEMGYDPEYLRPYFESYLDAVAQLQPEAHVFLCTAPPVNPALAGADCFTAGNCLAVNGLIRSLAEERDLGLLDVWALFADADNVLPASSTGDGIHLSSECYLTWARWLPLAMYLAAEE